MKTNLAQMHTMASRVPSWKARGSFNLGLFASNTTLLALLAMACVASCSTAMASDPIGIYALVDRVVLEPNDTAPERIQIWGVFSLAKPEPGDLYSAPQKGFLYYRVKPGAKGVCQKEWADLKRIAGTHQCIAFGTRYKEKGRVRKPGEELSNPDEYPVAQGVTKVRDSSYPPVKKLFEVAESGRTPARSNPAGKAASKPE